MPNELYREKIYPEGKSPDLDQVVDQLKRLDNKNKRLMFRMFMIFIVRTCDVVVTWALSGHTWPATWSRLTIILVIQAGYFTFMGYSYLIGYLLWRKKSRPLVRNLTRLIEEFKREEG